MYIESPQNVRVRAWSQLKNKKGRLRDGLFLVEGRRLVEELLKSPYPIEALLWNVATNEYAETWRSHPKLAGRIVELSPAAFAEVADTMTPQGIIAVASMPVASDEANPSGRAVLLDGVQDPGNVGTLLRTCEAFEFLTVCCGTNTVDAYAPKVVRSAMGGMFRLDLRDMDSVAFIEAWREAYPDGRVVVAAAQAELDVYEVDLSGDVLVVIGSEAAGVSAAVRARSTMPVSIPMAPTTESLNAAVAGSVMLYEAYRQSHTAG